MFLLQFNHGHTALALTVTSQPEAFDHPVAAQMFMNRGAQSTGTVAMDQIHHCLTVQNGAIDISIHLRQSFITVRPSRFSSILAERCTRSTLPLSRFASPVRRE